MNEFVIYWSDLTAEAQARILGQCQLSFKLSLDRPMREFGNTNDKADILNRKREVSMSVSTPAPVVTQAPAVPLVTQTVIEAKPVTKLEQCSTPDRDYKNYTKKKVDNRGRKINPADKKRGMEYIGEHDKEFGGTMGTMELARELQIAPHTVLAWRRLVKKELAN